eukprot:184747-Prymnesium_polylepis.1
MCASTQARRSTPGYSTRGRRTGLGNGEERDEPRTRATMRRSGRGCRALSLIHISEPTRRS